jgi:hypothetical protein
MGLSNFGSIKGAGFEREKRAEPFDRRCGDVWCADHRIAADRPD